MSKIIDGVDINELYLACCELRRTVTRLQDSKASKEEFELRLRPRMKELKEALKCDCETRALTLSPLEVERECRELVGQQS